MSKNNQKRATGIISVFADKEQKLTAMESAGKFESLRSDWKKKMLYPVAGIALVFLIGMGVMAKNNWLPSTDAMTGKKTGWFGRVLPANASSSWNPVAAVNPTPTPQLSKEYIYAGSRLLAVEDANANAAPPADLAVWRPSSGVWWVMGGQGSQMTALQWGDSSERPVPGDYDGDGKTDFSVYQPSNGIWRIVTSSSGSNGSVYTYAFGASGDKEAPADYDGDGKTDAAVFRPGTGSYANWYIQRSSDAGFVGIGFGLPSGDIPAPADYDGDGKADVAVWRTAAKTFYVLRSSTNQVQSEDFSLALGQNSTDKPVPADYDGDGLADFAVRSGANWIIKYSGSSGAPVSVSWESASDLSVHNDYDGDGKVDIAVWRGAESFSGAGDSGDWFIRQSSRIGQTDTLRRVHWGQGGDIPVPAFYRR